MRCVGVAALSLLLTSTVACATVEHMRITTSDEDKAATGVRYLGTSPYLIAYSDGKGGIVTVVKYLPDPAKLMSAHPEARLADAGTTMTFDRGVLTEAKDSGDATVVPAAIVEAAKTLGPALLAAMNKAAKEKQDGYHIPAPYIFKIVVKGSDVSLVGAEGDAPIKLTLLPPPAKEN
jgi:hypothetical protein